MRRKVRIDLGQSVSSQKEESQLLRKRQKWAQVNKNKPPEENPFLAAIHPDQEYFGDKDEKGDELKQRLNNLEYGNYPGYYNYRKVATTTAALTSKEEESPQLSVNAELESKNNSNHVESQIDDNTQAKSSSAQLTDERIKHLRKEWFFNKDVLDIGCNRGQVTYEIARQFSPNFIVGIDIDPKLIGMANRDLHLYLEDELLIQACELRKIRAAKLKLGENSEDYIEDDNHFPLSSYISQGPLIQSKNIIDDKQQSSFSEDIIEGNNNDNNRNSKEEEESLRRRKKENYQEFPNNLIFLEHNYVLSRDELVDKQKEQFDVVICLSVTKWIHLNYRDAGLKRFFKRVFRHLKSGGLFVLEAQPFDNYGRRKKLSDRLRANYYSIQFKPDSFDSYLLSEEIGFREIIYKSVSDHACNGFKRPIKVFLK